MRRRDTDKRESSLSDTWMLLSFIVCLLCWILDYVYSIGFLSEKRGTTMPLWTFSVRLYENKSVVFLSGLLLMIVVAFVIQRISDIKVLIRKHTRLPFLLFLLLISANAGLLSLREIAVVLLCLIIAVYDLFDSYQSPDATGKFFNTGVLTGFAGLFMPQIVWFIPLIWVGMYQFRSLNLRSFMASLIGVCVVYWIVTAWCLWNHDFSMMASFYDRWTDFKILSTEVFQYYRMGSVVVVVILVMAFFHIKMDTFGNSVRVRQMLSFLMNMSVWSFVLFLLYGADSDAFLAVMYLPSSILIPYFLENIGRVISFVLFYFMIFIWFASFLSRLWIF
jgi:hypothetical protein